MWFLNIHSTDGDEMYRYRPSLTLGIHFEL
jgi:hypothetical protein